MDIRILVIEDSELTRRMIRAVLQTRDWTICGEAENGLAGVDVDAGASEAASIQGLEQGGFVDQAPRHGAERD